MGFMTFVPYLVIDFDNNSYIIWDIFYYLLYNQIVFN